MIMQFNIGHLTQNIVLPWKNMSVNYSHADGFFCVSKVGGPRGIHAVCAKAVSCEDLGVTCWASLYAQLSIQNPTSVPSRAL